MGIQFATLVNGRHAMSGVEGVDFEGPYDVIVAGLGTAGAVAAVTAGRMGLRVLGLEMLTCMGGTGTAGGVMGYYYGLDGGIYEDLDAGVRAMEERVGYTPSGGVNGELKKYILERAALEAGVDISYESVVHGVYREGRQVVGVRWNDGRGIRSARARVVIDATGSAMVCALAGCATNLGREVDAQSQPYSMVGITLRPGRLGYYYTDCGYVDESDGDDLSRALVEGSSLPPYLRETVEGDNQLLYLATLPGVREGRLIVAEEQVRLQDVLDGRITEEPVFWGYANVDNHGKDVAFENEVHNDWIVGCSLWGLTFTIPVPLGALIPRDFGGIIAAGRCLGTDHDLAQALRMKRGMQKAGEVAATAAFLALERDRPLKDVPYHELASRLESTGCLDASHASRFVCSRDGSHKRWFRDPRRIRDALASESPGVGIWSARLLGDEIRDMLKQWLEAENEHLRKHSAIALALLSDTSALPILRQTVRERDPFLPKTSRTYNQVRGYAAIYLLGRLRDRGSVELLVDVLEDPVSGVPEGPLPEDVFIESEEDLCFQYASFALMALLKIGHEHPPTRERIANAVQTTLLQREQPAFEITLKGGWGVRYPMREKMRAIAVDALARWSSKPV